MSARIVFGGRRLGSTVVSISHEMSKGGLCVGSWMPVDTHSIVVCRDVGGLRQASAQSSSVLCHIGKKFLLLARICAVLLKSAVGSTRTNT